LSRRGACFAAADFDATLLFLNSLLFVPMTLDHLHDVERELNVTLPAPYVAYMRSYPLVLNETVIYIGDSPQTPAQWEFIGTRERLIELNRYVREPGVEWLEDGSPWPDTHFAIGEDIGGDCFSIRLAGVGAGVGADWDYSAGKSVFTFDHETGRFEPRASSLEAYARQVLAEYARYQRRR
jgi:hypothetical protein